MHQDPTSRATHYELTELGDETRHMVMFGKAIEHVGAKPVQPRWYQRVIINALPLGFKGSVLWVAALIGEEIFDSLQRQMMDDPELQPMVQRLMRIHVTEEARHIQFARDGLRKRAPNMRRLNRLWMSNHQRLGGLFFRYLFTNKVPYLPRRPRRAPGAPHRPHQPAPSRGSGRGLRPAGRLPRGGRPDGADRAPACGGAPASCLDDRGLSRRRRRRRRARRTAANQSRHHRCRRAGKLRPRRCRVRRSHPHLDAAHLPRPDRHLRPNPFRP